jgi:hypothetical protein
MDENGSGDRMEPQLRQDETPDEGTVVVDVFEIAPEEQAPPPASLIACTVETERAEVRGIAGVVHGSRIATRGITGMAIGDKVEVTGLTPVAFSSHKTEIERGAAGVAVGRDVVVSGPGMVGAALGMKVEVKDGGRVLVTPLIAVIIGLAVGMGFGLVMLAGYFVMRTGVGMLRERVLHR